MKNKFTLWMLMVLLAVCLNACSTSDEPEPQKPDPEKPVNPQPEPEKELEPQMLSGTWYLGYYRYDTTLVKFDGGETMAFNGNQLDWRGQQIGSEHYSLNYGEGFRWLVMTELNSHKVHGVTVVKHTKDMLVLYFGGNEYRYLYATLGGAQQAYIKLTDADKLLPDPAHNLTTDVEKLLTFTVPSMESTTPMGWMFEKAHKLTDEESQWLANPEFEPNTLEHLPNWRSCNVTLYPFGEPVPADVNQHAIGDCCCMAVFASYAYMYPEFIKSILTDNGNGTFTVNMFDPLGNPIEVGVGSTVMCNDQGSVGQCTGKNNVITWATILEKAMLKWVTIWPEVTPAEGIGTEVAHALFAGTGKANVIFPGTLFSEELTTLVKWGLQQERILVGGFTESGLKCDELETVTAHAFTLMYTAKSDFLFAMRNPWGVGTIDGVLNIPDEKRITQSIDVRLVYAGAAAPFKKKEVDYYHVPQYKILTTDIGVWPRLLNTEL